MVPNGRWPTPLTLHRPHYQPGCRQAEVEAQAQAGLLEGGVDEIDADVNDSDRNGLVWSGMGG
ncbi:hypothetical protein EDB81DRAFT_835110 [Dactylonectria macrodidyma]|uniref:Uncharacterized protein n=1 Tax=Dactylonectria macrodidyma TaxID=307937 RepID=A0A9P9CXQ0_9HYPO|nr:hypothetical protein EDB81DRAFT_835110 [Dactylonectria macrodidyma]